MLAVQMNWKVCSIRIDLNRALTGTGSKKAGGCERILDKADHACPILN
jgi:hypothetical protein